jgi:transposase
MKHITLQQFHKMFPHDDACLEHMMMVRFGLEHTCRKCQRDSKFSRVSSQRAFACQWCGDHVYPCVNTPFEDSRTKLHLWFYALYLLSTSRHGVPAKELERQLGVTYKCAWRMGHQIRKYMAKVDGETPLSGTVEVDETYIGGKTTGGKRGRGAPNKTVVFGMLQKDGDVMTKVVPNVKRVTLEPIIEANVAKGSTIHTDELRSYSRLGNNGYNHETVNHGCGEYVKGNTHVNGMEGYWSRLKLSIRGTHVHVSQKYLENYAKEFEYRFNSRKCHQMMLPEMLAGF